VQRRQHCVRSRDRDHDGKGDDKRVVGASKASSGGGHREIRQPICAECQGNLAANLPRFGFCWIPADTDWKKDAKANVAPAS
jgi:hypothetical protein